MRKFLKQMFRVCRAIFLIVVGAGGVAALCGWIWYQDVMKDVPDVPDLSTLYGDYPSRLQTNEGHRIAGALATRTARMHEISPMVVAAFLAAEDSDFFFHDAYSIRGIARAALENYQGKARSQGASTITQQVARQFLTREKTYRRKMTELLLAQRIERVYRKPEILHAYLESVFLGHRAEGVTQAAWRYFGKLPSELSLAESATLAGIAPAPSRYNPRASVENATRERGRVLRRMRELGMISETEENDALNESMVVRGERPPTNKTLYYAAIREAQNHGGENAWNDGGLVLETPSNPDVVNAMTQSLQRGVHALERRQGLSVSWRTEDVDALREFLKSNAQETDVKIGVVTAVSNATATVDVGQPVELSLADNRWAEPTTTKRHFKKPAKLKSFSSTLVVGDVVHVERVDGAWELQPRIGFQGGVFAMESQTGRPVAHVGSHDPQNDTFNRVWQGCRQPGSVFKPVVYAEAFSQGLSPATMVSDVPVELDTRRGGVWRPRNADRDFKGYITIARALASSRNVPVATLMDHLGAGRVVKRARNLGIESPINASSAASLGANCTKPWEVGRLYTAFQRKGWSTNTSEFSRVVRTTVDSDGVVHDALLERAHFSWPEWSAFRQANRAIRIERRPARGVSEQVAFLMSEQLRFVATRGTAHELPKQWVVGGKTGTTNKYDAWFAGFDGKLTTVVWVGSDKNTRPLGNGEHGATVALPIFADFYAPFARIDGELAEIPPGVDAFRIDPETGLLAQPGEFGLTYTFVTGTEPTEFAPNLGAKQSQHLDELIYDF